jgi:tRNA A37 threonylcarbamoyladenosine biosynthesis protein TsaE
VTITLNDDQTQALAEILAAQGRGARHLLTGYAGSGKTTLMQALARKRDARSPFASKSCSFLRKLPSLRHIS